VPAPADLALDALESIAAAVLVAAPDGTVLFANPAARKLGLRGRGSRLPPALTSVAASARAEGRAFIQQITLPAPSDLTLRLRRVERTGPSVRVRAHAIGPAAYVVLVLEDLTEALRVEAVRRDFVANVSHELKTPVGAMQLLAEALHEASDDPEAVRHFAQRMTKEATRLGLLVQELIDLSRLQGAEPLKDPKPAAMEQAVHEAVDRNRLPAEAKAIRVVVVRESGEGPDEPLVVFGDEAQLATAVANLLENAIAYSPDHTRVIIGMRRRDDIVEVSVADEGIGIAEADQERVFERFYRADPARSRATGGTGLGLAIVKHIASNHDGEVVLWSAGGKGSTFTLRLPAHQPDSDDAAPDSQSADPRASTPPGRDTR
jgi:two-component system sensor histidine kinase SenX3